VAAGIIARRVNTEMMNQQRARRGAQVGPGARVMLVCDRAAWDQKGKRLQIPKTISLLPLPLRTLAGLILS
jgi:hypothetical protein